MITLLCRQRFGQGHNAKLALTAVTTRTTIGGSSSLLPGRPHLISANVRCLSSSSSDSSSNSEETKSKTGRFTSYISTAIRKTGVTDDEDLIRIIAKTTTVASFSLLSITALGTVGVDTKPFIAGIGVTGFAAGFALKEIATNYLSGVLLVFSKQFTKGQYIKVLSSSGLEGVVESVDIRHVVLRTKDNGLLMIPSSIVYSNPIVILPKQP